MTQKVSLNETCRFIAVTSRGIPMVVASKLFLSVNDFRFVGRIREHGDIYIYQNDYEITNLGF